MIPDILSGLRPDSFRSRPHGLTDVIHLLIERIQRDYPDEDPWAVLAAATAYVQTRDGSQSRIETIVTVLDSDSIFSRRNFHAVSD